MRLLDWRVALLGRCVVCLRACSARGNAVVMNTMQLPWPFCSQPLAAHPPRSLLYTNAQTPLVPRCTRQQPVAAAVIVLTSLSTSQLSRSQDYRRATLHFTAPMAAKETPLVLNTPHSHTPPSAAANMSGQPTARQCLIWLCAAAQPPNSAAASTCDPLSPARSLCTPAQTPSALPLPQARLRNSSKGRMVQYQAAVAALMTILTPGKISLAQVAAKTSVHQSMDPLNRCLQWNSHCQSCSTRVCRTYRSIDLGEHESHAMHPRQNGKPLVPMVVKHAAAWPCCTPSGGGWHHAAATARDGGGSAVWALVPGALASRPSAAEAPWASLASCSLRRV